MRPCYLDDLREERVIAPPAFCVVPEWTIINGGDFRQSLGVDNENAWRGIQVYQDTIFHRPVCAPERLIAAGRVTEIRQTSIGAMVTATFTTHAANDGQPVSETWWSTIYVGMTCEAPRVAVAPPKVPHADGRENVEQVRIEVPRFLPHIYSECAGIWNPIHTERAIAKRNGLPDIITHGTAIWALVGEALIDRIGEGQPSRLKRLACRFKTAVIPGTAIHLNLSRSDVAGAIFFTVENDTQKSVLTDGFAEFA